ncbi:hypothetical protein SDC9_68113 [bioreactor metagenome]|uniref:SLH domain-containing protein n=1 Tax=bioreactor metagenome TaxID=1076179 RepID=A0A644Y0W6_9ZZZZ
MEKRAFAMILCIVICISLVPVTALAISPRDTSFEETLAGDLKSLGLFKGVSDTDFDLNRAPSRLEAIIMLIRVLGVEQEALNGSFTHPFTDVPQWADKYVGYAYETGLTRGMSDTLFGTGNADAGTYLTFVLRALGYSDTGGLDFTWNNPYDLARNIGILPDCVNLTDFLRADVATISYAALPATLKGSNGTLAQKLISAQVFTLADYETNYDASTIASHMNTLTEMTAEEIYAKCSPAVFYVEVYDSKGYLINSGSGFFIDSNGTGVTNFHVINRAYQIKITRSDTGEVYDVLGVYDYDEDEDWAIIKVDGTGFPFLKPASESTVVGGAMVYAIGSPLGLQNTISQGLISNPKRADENGLTYIQTSAAISPGSSGGALINRYGEVVGITSATYAYGQNLNLALPISYISGYQNIELVSLSALFDKPQAELQRQAYEALSNWIVKNANEEVYGFPGYYECFGPAEYELVYDEDLDYIMLVVFYVTGKYLQISYIELTSSEQEYYSDFKIYDITVSEEEQSVFYGIGNIYAPSLNQDSSVTFSTYTGDSEILEECESIAKSMYLSSLEYLDFIFATYIPGYSIRDFGFEFN